MVQTGLDRLLLANCTRLKGKSIGILCHQASIASDLRHILDHLLPRHNREFQITRVFGPQHGLWGHTQDNMIEWEGSVDSRTGLNIISLYGEHREPTAEMLEGLDLLVVDLQDVGARYYTFIWSMALCMKVCEKLSIPILVLDRPNPIGGAIEGTVLNPEYRSFVGLYPLPTRHGLTIAEVATHLRATHFPSLDLWVEPTAGNLRGAYGDETCLPWALPSPNMPSVETAVVYPGGCLLEATNISEGRGTTQPFETFGASFIDGWSMADRLNAAGLPGVHFRPVQFQPTFHKFSGEICEGAFVHVTDRQQFKPVLTYIAVLRDLVHQYPQEFAWKQPPYEYEYEKLPIDILAGNSWLREEIEKGTSLSQIDERMQAECERFEPHRKEALLY